MAASSRAAAHGASVRFTVDSPTSCGDCPRIPEVSNSMTVTSGSVRFSSSVVWRIQSLIQLEHSRNRMSAWSSPCVMTRMGYVRV